MTGTQAQVQTRRSRRDTDFFLPAALVLLALMVWGFGPSFFWAAIETRPHSNMLTDRGPAARLLLLAHGIAFAAWTLLYALQSGLVAARRTALHRRMGLAAVGLVPVIVLLGVAVTIKGLQVGFHRLELPPLSFAAGAIMDVIAFALFAGLGLWQRRQPAAHKRWMLLATMVLIGAATARIGPIGALMPAGLAMALLLVALAAWDLASLRRLHPVTLWGGALYLAVDLGAEPLASSAAGLAVLHWLVG